MKIPRRLGLVLLALLAAAALAALAYAAWLWRFALIHGADDVHRFDAPRPAITTAASIDYARDVKPIFEKRCVVCHACYDAPCQLKLGSFEGIARGLSAAPVYDGQRLAAAAPSRLYIDAETASQWREQGFSPVLNEYRTRPGDNRALSLISRLMALKRAHPQPASGLSDKNLDYGINRAQSCPKIQDFKLYEKTHPEAGMPFGLPGLSAAEEATINRWLDAGAPAAEPPAPPAEVQQMARDWESFLNGDSLKERLMSRYLYEHLFLAHLYLDGAQAGPAYRLVRSASPPGAPVAQIATRRPFDDPGVARVYYRLQPDREPIVAKTHMPYRFDRTRMARYRALFLTPDYPVAALPDYDPDTASNGLASFADMPESARYRFMLDDAQYFIMTFIKGPVCRGQVALNVIEDRFFVFFLAPQTEIAREPDDVARRALERMSLPAADGSDSAAVLTDWRNLAAQEQSYLAARAESLKRFAKTLGGPRLDMIWDGDGDNPNAALTVLRHFDNATIVRGLVGAPAKTAWVIDYGLFERIYYLLAAGYDVFGNLTHNLNSRLYMDFLRMEGEANFISFLPAGARAAQIDYWYRDASRETLEHMRALAPDAATDIAFDDGDAKLALYAMIERRLAPALDRRLSLARAAPQLRAPMEALAALRGPALSLMPELAHMAVADARGEVSYFTLVKDAGHFNVTRLLLERNELAPEENALTVVPGLIGAYPNALFRLKAAELPALAEAIAGLRTEQDYAALSARFAVRRTDPGFWEFSDALQAAEARMDQADRGLLDYNRLENR